MARPACKSFAADDWDKSKSWPWNKSFIAFCNSARHLVYIWGLGYTMSSSDKATYKESQRGSETFLLHAQSPSFFWLHTRNAELEKAEAEIFVIDSNFSLFFSSSSFFFITPARWFVEFVFPLPSPTDDDRFDWDQISQDTRWQDTRTTDPRLRPREGEFIWLWPSRGQLTN